MKFNIRAINYEIFTVHNNEKTKKRVKLPTITYTCSRIHELLHR